MEKKKVTIRLDDNTMATYLKQYKEITPAVQNAAQVFLQLKRYTMLELKGMFIREEILALVDCLNATMRQDEYMRRSVLIANMEDSETLDDISGRWEFNPIHFHQKLDNLTEAQAYFLMDRIYVFWEMESSKENGLEDLVKELGIR